MSIAVNHFDSESDTVNAKDYVISGTGFHTFIGMFVAIFGGILIFLVSVLATYGIALIIWIVALLMISYTRKKAHAKLLGSALRVGPQQFPEIYSACNEMSRRLTMDECPEIFIIEDNVHNAFALKKGRRKYVILIDDVIFGAESTGSQDALNFIIGHELAHHALGHTGVIKSFIVKNYRPLSRLNEFSCDAVANALVGNIQAAQDALCLLLVGPQLFHRVNKEALHEQAQEVSQNKLSKKVENGLSHPLLLRRFGRLLDARI